MPLGRKAAAMLRAQDKLLIKGLGALKESTARDLAGFLRANGLGKASDRALLMREPGPEKRYRAFVELRIALEEAVVKLFRPDRLGIQIPKGVTLVTEEALPEGIVGLLAAARSFPGTAPAQALLARGPELAALAPEAVATLLANDDLRDLAATSLRAAPLETLQGWVTALATHSNGMARRGAYLLTGKLDAEDAVRRTRPSWVRREDQAAAFEAFHGRRMEARPAFAELLNEGAAPELEGRRFALRMVARSARAGEADQWEAAAEDDAELAALLKVARFKAEEVGFDRLRSWASSVDDPELRVTAGLQSWLDGDADPRFFQQELRRGPELMHLLLGPLRGTSRMEPHFRRWQEALRWEHPVSERRAAATELLACGDQRLAPELLWCLEDPDEEVRTLLFPFLCQALGLLPARRKVDFTPFLDTPYEQFSTDQLHGFERYLLPALAHSPDLRLAPYVGYLLGRFGARAVPEATLTAFGASLIPTWAGFLHCPEAPLRALAFEHLEALRQVPAAAAVLLQHEGGLDPVEGAVEKLLVAGLRPEAQAELETLDREQTVPRLLEIARARRAARDPILEVLTAWRAEAAVPFMMRLLGSPLPDMVRGKLGARELRWLEKPIGPHLLAFGPTSVAPLTKALSSENWTVRHHAAALLAQLAVPESAEALARALEDETTPETFEVLLEALGAAGGPRAVEAVEHLARSSSPREQMQAVRTLRQISGEESRRLLEAMAAEATDLALKRELRRVLSERRAP